MKPERMTEFQLCSSLSRALAHRLRGDLSVVTNDLAYISTIVDPSEVARARTRCIRMADALAVLGVLPGELELQLLEIESIANLFEIRPVIPNASWGRLLVDPRQLEQFTTLLKDLIGSWSGPVTPVVAQDIYESDFSPVFKFIFSEQKELRQRYFSLADFSLAELGERSVVEGCLADLIVRAHNWRVEIEQEGPLVVMWMMIPR